MKRTFIAGLLLILITAVFALVAYADKPVEYQLVQIFDLPNPCSGLVETHTFTLNLRDHIHNGKLVRHANRTITTETGYIGRGTEQWVDNGQVFKFSQNDMLVNDAGDRIRAHWVYIMNFATDPPSLKVDNLTVICVGN
jgi:hypothetical protein